MVWAIAWAPGPAISWFQSVTSCSTVIGGSVEGSIACGPPSIASPPPTAPTGNRDGEPANTIPAPGTSRATPISPTRRMPRTRLTPALASPPTSRDPKPRMLSAADLGSGTSRSTIGRAAQTATSPDSSATFVPNSSVIGASSSVLAIATSSPNTTRPTWPPGTVLGSVIMKNRKIMTSGEVTMTRQKSNPQTGANAQFAVMQWPDAASSPTPTVSATQNVAARPRSFNRRVIISPPTMTTAYAAIIQTLSGAHQKSSGSTRVLPSTMNATTSPMFDGVKTCETRYLITYFVRRENAATPAKTHHESVFHGWSGGVPTTRRIRATPLPVSIALAGQTNVRVERNVSATSITAVVRIAARICGMLTRKWRPTWPRTWTVMITAATWSRGSRIFGRISGEAVPPKVRVRPGRVTEAWDIGRHSRAVWPARRCPGSGRVPSRYGAGPIEIAVWPGNGSAATDVSRASSRNVRVTGSPTACVVPSSGT